MTQTLSGKVAIVTGASSGIGAATAEELARMGAAVLASARRKEKLEAVVGGIAKAGGKVIFFGSAPKLVMDKNFLTATGPADIEAWLTQSVPPAPKRMHYVMNSIIAVDGNAATARSNYLVMVEGPEGPVPSVCGTYADRFVRTSDGWRFQRRELIHAFKGEMRLQLP